MGGDAQYRPAPLWRCPLPDGPPLCEEKIFPSSRLIPPFLSRLSLPPVQKAWFSDNFCVETWQRSISTLFVKEPKSLTYAHDAHAGYHRSHCQPAGIGALGMIRISGSEAIALVNQIFSRDLSQARGYTLHYGKIMRGDQVLDEVVASVFRAPKSFTKEDVVEISTHGSPYILREALQILVDAGARLAEPGRVYPAGLPQRGHGPGPGRGRGRPHRRQLRRRPPDWPCNQLRGGVSDELKDLRGQLLHFTSLIELELDFGEEDVEFADRHQLTTLVQNILKRVEQLIDSFQLGNALKQGVPTVILGKPNAGKSTLLNALLNENRAIVSDIPGTTRDMIEDRLHIGGIEFRLQDTAGVRETADQIEAEGVSRSLALAQTAALVLYVFDVLTESPPEAQAYVQSLDLPAHTEVLLISNKTDLLPSLPTGKPNTKAASAPTTPGPPSPPNRVKTSKPSAT
jgi:tRNA modification GTPase